MEFKTTWNNKIPTIFFLTFSVIYFKKDEILCVTHIAFSFPLNQ